MNVCNSHKIQQETYKSNYTANNQQCDANFPCNHLLCGWCYRLWHSQNVKLVSRLKMH